MPFGYRKSVNAGPFKLNFSKAGVGVSVGVKGARVGLNSRGTYVRVGHKGVYYSKYASHKKRSQSRVAPSPHAMPVFEEAQAGNLEARLREALETATPNDLLEKLDKSNATAWEAYVVGVLAFFIFASSGTGVALFLALAIFFGLRWWGRSRRKAKLIYSLDEAGKNTLGAFQQIVNHLSLSERLWFITHSELVADRKYSGGAGVTVQRLSATAGPMKMPGVETNIEVHGIDVEKGPKFFFLPDGLYVYENGKYGVFPHNEMNWLATTTRFIESERPPSDGREVGSTFQYVNKRGSPDKRFKFNPRRPIMNYGLLHASSDGFELEFHVSSEAVANDAGLALTELALILTGLREREKQESRQSARTGQSQSDTGQKSNTNRQQPGAAEPPPSSEKPTVLAALALFALSHEEDKITPIQIRMRYRELAKQYHPDRVAHLPEEFGEVANRKMIELNEARDLLEARFA